jgi:hypothetical protein
MYIGGAKLDSCLIRSSRLSEIFLLPKTLPAIKQYYQIPT